MSVDCFERGMTHLDQGQYQEVIEGFKKALNVYYNHIKSCYDIDVVFKALDEYNKTLDNFYKTVEKAQEEFDL